MALARSPLGAPIPVAGPLRRAFARRAMIGVAAALVAHGGADRFGNGGEILDESSTLAGGVKAVPCRALH